LPDSDTCSTPKATLKTKAAATTTTMTTITKKQQEQTIC
jgi:hypothetical protein